MESKIYVPFKKKRFMESGKINLYFTSKRMRKIFLFKRFGLLTQVSWQLCIIIYSPNSQLCRIKNKLSLHIYPQNITQCHEQINRRNGAGKRTKLSEDGVALYHDKGEDEEWIKIRSLVPTKTIDEIKVHFKKLKDDLDLIESGFLPVNIDYQPKNQ